LIARAGPVKCPQNGRLPFLFVVVFRVLFRMMLRGLLAMMGRVQSMRMRHVGMMAGLLVITAFVMFGRFTVMMRSGLVMVGCGLVVAATFVRLRTHVALPSLRSSSTLRLRPKSDRRMNAC
jgi:hypothetical protein